MFVLKPIEFNTPIVASTVYCMTTYYYQYIHDDADATRTKPNFELRHRSLTPVRSWPPSELSLGQFRSGPSAQHKMQL